MLIHAFCGCETGDVLAAIGLSLGDLFDTPIAHRLEPIRGGFTARELLELTAHEASVVTLLACDAQRQALNDAQLTRLAQAAGRLQRAQDIANGR